MKTALPLLLFLLPAGLDAARPNIVIAITDDQSWEHASAYGCSWISTPQLDQLAENGIIATHAFSQVPSCTPSRGSLLTGRDPWLLAEGATLWSLLPAYLDTFPERLEEAGYFVGHFGKGWGPGDLVMGGRSNDPLGNSYGSFSGFNNQRPKDRPFLFWFGSSDPHRPYTRDSGISGATFGKEDVVVPGFLPDTDIIRRDLLDYAYEIERFDRHLGDIIYTLGSEGILENTLIIVTSDNGMPFPGAKSNLYDHGTRMPLVLHYPGILPANHVYEEFITLADLAPTILEAAGIQPSTMMTGKSHWGALTSTETSNAPPVRDHVLLFMERHAYARHDFAGYPMRAIRTSRYLYIQNAQPFLWPAGDPPGYLDIDGGPSKSFIQANSGTYPESFQRSFAKRPEEELYDLLADPYSMNNLAGSSDFSGLRNSLRQSLETRLQEAGDWRAYGLGDFYQASPYTRSSIPDNLGGFTGTRQYHPGRLADFQIASATDADGNGRLDLWDLALLNSPTCFALDPSSENAGADGMWKLTLPLPHAEFFKIGAIGFPGNSPIPSIWNSTRKRLDVDLGEHPLFRFTIEVEKSAQ